MSTFPMFFLLGLPTDRAELVETAFIVTLTITVINMSLRRRAAVFLAKEARLTSRSPAPLPKTNWEVAVTSSVPRTLAPPPTPTITNAGSGSQAANLPRLRQASSALKLNPSKSKPHSQSHDYTPYLPPFDNSSPAAQALWRNDSISPKTRDELLSLIENAQNPK